MSILKFINKIILQLLISIFFFSNIHAKNLDIYYRSDKVSDYFSGIISLSENNYNKSYNFFKKLDGLEDSHPSFASTYLYSLINSEKFNEAFKFSKKLENKSIDSFESNLIIGIYYLKNKRYELAREYSSKIKKKYSQIPLQKLISQTFYNWVNFEKNKYQDAQKAIDNIDPRLLNMKKIQNVFLQCYYDTSKVDDDFKKLISYKDLDNNSDFSRYNFFYANYLISKKDINTAEKIINLSLDIYPRNLILNQLKLDLQNKMIKNYTNIFNCKDPSHIIAEIFYITANAMSVKNIYSFSNFYLNLAKYLNPDFVSFETLTAQNFSNIDNLKNSKKSYLKIKLHGDIFEWYASQKISRILSEQKKEEEAVELLKKSYNKIKKPNIYQTYDLASFLRTHDEYKESIKYYSKVLNLIDKNHSLYPKSTDGRGIAYERVGDWEKAEKDFLNSLSVEPNQAYVINYLAYSWIEKGKNIDKSLQMLKKANQLKKNDGYIIDSLGWALFKLKRYKEANRYLQIAVRLMPVDPVVNDHYADSLWMINKKLQARYHWNHVLNFKKTEKDLKKQINNKFISGPDANL